MKKKYLFLYTAYLNLIVALGFIIFTSYHVETVTLGEGVFNLGWAMVALAAASYSHGLHLHHMKVITNPPILFSRRYGAAIKHVRESKELTGILGMSEETLATIENGERLPTVNEIADYLAPAHNMGMDAYMQLLSSTLNTNK